MISALQNNGLLRSVLGLFCVVVLSGCDEAKPDLQAYVKKIQARPVRALDPLPAPEAYQPVPYEQAGGRNPFAAVVLVVIESKTKKKISKIQPNLTRDREELEQFALSELRLVGTLEKEETLYALIARPDGEVVIARKGNYIGKNYGLVKSVEESTLVLREIVKDAEGLWEKRTTTFGFQE